MNRLFSLGVSPGASIEVLQIFPALVVLCDQTELALERGVGEAVLVSLES